MRRFRIIMMVGILLCILPVAVLLAADGVAIIANCQLEEGRAHPCPMAGVDIGGLLYFLALRGMIGAFFALPTLACAAVLWAVTEAIFWWRSRVN